MNRHQRLLTLVGILWGATLAYLMLRPARIRAARVTSLSRDDPCYAYVMWSYSAGKRPVSVVIDLIAGNGTCGSLTTDGETVSARIPMSARFRDTYTLDFTATFRILGFYRTRSWTFSSRLSEG